MGRRWCPRESPALADHGRQHASLWRCLQPIQVLLSDCKDEGTISARRAVGHALKERGELPEGETAPASPTRAPPHCEATALTLLSKTTAAVAACVGLSEDAKCCQACHGVPAALCRRMVGLVSLAGAFAVVGMSLSAQAFLGGLPRPALQPAWRVLFLLRAFFLLPMSKDLPASRKAMTLSFAPLPFTALRSFCARLGQDDALCPSSPQTVQQRAGGL